MRSLTSVPAPEPREDGEPAAGTARSGTGEMARLIAELDWARTPLGPRDSWPQSLHTAVDICLASRFPIVMCWGPELRLLYNDGYRPMLGSEKHPDALGQPAAEVWAEIWDVIEPMFRSVLERREATWSDDQLLLIDRGGVEESYFTFSYSPVAGEAGEVAGVFCAVTETTARVLGERRLATLRDLASSTAEARSVEEACRRAVGSLSGNRLDLPLATLHLVGADGATTTFGDPPVLADRQVASAVEGGRRRFDGLSVEIELPLLGRQTVTSVLALPIQQAGQDAAQAVLVVGVSPVRKLDADYLSFFELTAGQVATALADASAYTAERERAERLAELDRAKTEFFSNVSHEFRTPLTLMLGPLEEALRDPDGALDAETREAVTVAHRNALRLLKLVNTLLDFSRIEAGRTQASFQPVDLARLTAELASVFRSAVERAGMRLEVRCEPTPDPVWVDPELWEKIVLNLLSNAFKFTFEGTIAVRLRARPGHVDLVVEDTGIGISNAELPHLFERFHRVHGARSRSHEGSGIGLALVRELVRLHGGTIEVTSVVDRGTAFTVSLPTGSSHLPRDRIAAPRELASTATAGSLYVEEALRWLPEDLLDAPPLEPPAEEAAAPEAQILLVDDNADMRAYLRRLLSTRYEVETAPDGVEALHAARRRRPDLVVSDVMMPRLDGIQLLAALRADPLTREVPVVLLSARAGEESRVAGLDAGADDYLVKPFAANELLARVRAQIELARVRREALETIQEDEERQAFFLTLSDALRPIVDPVEVQTTAVRLVGRHLGVARAMYAEVDEDGIHAVVHRDYCEDGVPSARGRYRIDDFGSTLSAAAYSGTALAVDDVAAERQLTGPELERFAAIGVEAFALVPLVKGNGLAGLLVVHHTAPRTWRPDEIALLEETAERTWAAIQRARAEAALEQDLRDMDLLRSLAGRLASDADEETLYQDVLAVAIAIAHADGGELVVLEEGGDDLRTVARAGVVGRGAPGYTTALTSRSGAPLGTFSTWRERRRPSARETRFLDLLARQAADIIEHRRAQQARRERERERQERLAERARRQHWLAGEQAERTRWARELHDETLQGLAAIQVQLVAALQAPTPNAGLLEAVVSLVHGEIVKLRSLIAELRPPALAEYGLAPALAALADETKQRGGPDVVLAVDLGDGDGRLPEELELAIYRVVQEALTNASRHAGATRVEVEVRRRAAVVEAIVRDDGSGFAPGTPTAGFGLAGMAERATIVGGRLEIGSEEGRGTSVRLETPVS